MSKRKRVADMIYHYTYRITNTKERMYYYGVHSCDCLPKEEIGIIYHGSSKRKEFIDDQKQNPQDYKYKVLKLFPTRKEAVEHEIFLHAKFNVKCHKQFYNDANQTSTGFDTTGKANYLDENGERVFLTREEAFERGLKGVPKTEEHKAKLAALYEGKTFEEIHGVEKAKEVKQSISKAQIGISRITPEGRRQLSIKKTGVPCFNAEQKLEMSIERKDKIHVKNVISKVRYRLDETDEFKINPFLVGSTLKLGYEIILKDEKFIIFKYEFAKHFANSLNIGIDLIRNLASRNAPFVFNPSGVSKDKHKYYQCLNGMIINSINIVELSNDYIMKNIDNIYNPYNFNIKEYIENIMC